MAFFSLITGSEHNILRVICEIVYYTLRKEKTGTFHFLHSSCKLSPSRRRDVGWAYIIL